MPAVLFWTVALGMVSAFYGICVVPQARKLRLEQLGIGIWFLKRAWPECIWGYRGLAPDVNL